MLKFCLIFCQFQLDIAYKSVAYKKAFILKLIKVFHKGQGNGKWLQTKKWIIEEKKKRLKSSETVVHSCSTDYSFWEFQNLRPAA